jgi:hypothetical protein
MGEMPQSLPRPPHAVGWPAFTSDVIKVKRIEKDQQPIGVLGGSQEARLLMVGVDGLCDAISVAAEFMASCT